MPDANTRRLPARSSPAPAKVGHPHKVLHLTSYDRLEQYLRAFAGGHFGLVILVGSGGLAKSRSVRAALNGRACWIEGNATPFGMYLKLYRHRDQVVVIDDVDALYADRSGVRLLKCLCQTEEEKSVAWHSDARSLEKQGIPREFTTKSRVVIISNDWKTLNKNVAALQDRGHVLLFEPDAAEVHRKAGTWFDDPEIYAWFAANLHRVREPSMRHYVRARELKAADMDWNEVLAAEAENPRARLAGELLASAAYASMAARVKAFVEQGGGCRATFFNYRRKLGNGNGARRLSKNSICALKPGEISKVYGRKTLAIPPILSIQMLFLDSLLDRRYRPAAAGFLDSWGFHLIPRIHPSIWAAARSSGSRGGLRKPAMLPSQSARRIHSAAA